MYDAVAELIQEHRTTLVFTLSRRWAERIALNLQKRLGNDAVMAHHGSLARAERLAAEQRLKRGELRALVATASLELGIDVGAVELVCQIDSPKSISAAIQRIGRSGHRPRRDAKGAPVRDDPRRSARMRRRGAGDSPRPARRGRDSRRMPRRCGAANRRDRRGRRTKSARPICCACCAARTISPSLTAGALAHLLDQMAAELPARIQGAAPKIFYDRIGARVRARRGARIAAITSGGTIPESGNLDVVIESQERKIGDVEEDFAQESSRGDIFALGSMPWQMLRHLAQPLAGRAGARDGAVAAVLADRGGGPLARALLAEVSELARRNLRASRAATKPRPRSFLADECAMDHRAARQAVDYVRRGHDALGAIPDEHTIVVERFFDGLGGTQMVIHSPFGIRVNRGLGLALRKRLCQSFDFEIQASATDDGVLLALNARHSFPLEDR